MTKKRKNIDKVPNLRFPEFKEEWEEKKLKDIATFYSGGTPLTSKKEYFDGNIPFIRSGEINSDKTEQFISELGLKNSSAKMVEVGDVLYALYGATSGEVGISKIKGAINQAVLCIKTDNDQYFLASYLRYKKEDITKTYLQGGQGNLSAEIIKNLKISFPQTQEQKKIADFLFALDSKIQTQKKIIQNLETLIKGLCQKLSKNKNWKRYYLRDILTERKETNKDNLSVFSVSVSRGVINQIEYLGRSFSAKNTDNYNVVHFGDIVYTKSPTGEFPYGIIKQSFIENKVAVSPLYGAYVPKNIYIGNILHYYFSNPINTNNYLHSLVQKGAKNTINITNQRFLDNEILLPTDEKEVKTIALLLNSINNKIETEKKFLELLEQQKKYFLQNLFI
jgi:type I restriction enzyme S subunit